MKNQSLEYIVKTYFPLIEDKFNFRLGTVKGISVSYNKKSFSVYIINKNTSLSTTAITKDLLLEKYINIIKQYLTSHVDNPHFDTLLQILMKNITPKVEKLFERRKTNIDELCKFECARFRNPQYHDYSKILSKENKYLINVYYTSTDRYKETPMFNIGKNNLQVTVQNISKIMQLLEDKYILNNVQRKEILIRLNNLALGKSINQDKGIPINLSFDELKTLTSAISIRLCDESDEKAQVDNNYKDMSLDERVNNHPNPKLYELYRKLKKIEREMND